MSKIIWPKSPKHGDVFCYFSEWTMDIVYFRFLGNLFNEWFYIGSDLHLTSREYYNVL